MRDYELEILEQYHIEVGSTRKIRGAFFCDTEQGVMILKEVQYSTQRAPFYYMICKQLEESGFGNVDTIVPNAEGAFLSQSRDGRRYVLKKWFRGSECDVKNEREILAAAANLAKLHLVMNWRAGCDVGQQAEIVPPLGTDLRQILLRHNQELVKVRKFIRRQSTKHDFEAIFLKSFEMMYAQAESVRDKLEKSEYESLYQEVQRKQSLTHGDYNYHNIILTQNGIATTNFERAHLDIQVSDLSYFIRKVMEKQHWKPELCRKILRAYAQIRPLSEAEMEYISLRLAYPEKFWKTVNSYYLSNKSWISVKMVEKLEQTILETEEKRYFLNEIFSFLL